MNSQDIKRKLTAILSADVEGYSRLMGEDEVGTIRTLTDYRDAMTNLILLHRGRVVDAPGDNLLAEFVSVVDAVQCAVEIQRELAERNQELPEDKRMHFRIGVNLGDVVEEKERIYGDGVNIAARLESLCEGGGVCISGAAFENVENKLDLEFEDLGEHEVKNIAKPVRVYRVLSYPGAAAHRVIRAKKAVGKKWRRISFTIAAVLIITVAASIIWNLYFRSSDPQIEAASEEKMALPLPDKPSIAVLPFVNMSDDPDQEFFSDGITEDIITDLSKISGLLVISRSSTFAYKGKPVKIKNVAEEFGVRYVLEGSVRKDSEKIRINVQLIDAITGHHLWADRYDGDWKDIFTLQDEITQKIVMTLRVEVREAELERIKHIPTENLTAYESTMRGVRYLRSRKKPANSRARLMFERAIELDPEYAWPYAGLGWTHLAEWWWGWTDDPRVLEQALEMAQKAIRLDNSYAVAYRLLGMIYLWKDRQHEQAIAAAEKAVALDPNHPGNYSTLAEILKFSGKPEEVIDLMEKAMRLNPRYPGSYLFQSGSSYYYMGRYDEALAHLKRAATHWPNHLPTRAYLAAIYTEFGQEENVRAEVAEIYRITPNYSMEQEARYPYKDPAYGERIRSHLRKAGIPDKPPLPLPDKPSIAVLPFENVSDDPELEYVSNGLTEDIITALSKVPRLFVIARNSTFIYKRKADSVQQVGRKLGVKYVLEGSVRKAGERVRITAQLINAINGHHLWAERYDRELKDIFDLQDEITYKIFSSLQIELTEGEQVRVWSKETKNIKAYEKFIKGLEHFRLWTNDGNLLARELWEEALEIDPQFTTLYAALAYTYSRASVWGWSENPKASFQKAEKLAKNALSLHESHSETYGLLGNLSMLKGEYDQAVSYGAKAVVLNPNGADVAGFYALNLSAAGRQEEAIAWFKKSERLNPITPAWVLLYLGRAYILAGRYEDAIEVLKKILTNNPDFIGAHIYLATAYSLAGRDEYARVSTEEVLRINPKFSLKGFSSLLRFKAETDKTFLMSAMQKAGLK